MNFLLLLLFVKTDRKVKINWVVVSFFLAYKDFGEGCQIDFRLRFFPPKWGSARAHEFHFLGQGMSTLAQPAETNEAQSSQTSSCELVSPIGSALCLDSIVGPVRPRLVKSVCMVRCNLPLKMTGVFYVSRR